MKIINSITYLAPRDAGLGEVAAGITVLMSTVSRVAAPHSLRGQTGILHAH